MFFHVNSYKQSLQVINI